MSEHTALPWRVGDAGTTVFGPPNGNPSPVTVAHTTRANAAYIVRACNALPALVSALERALSAIETPGDLNAQDRKYLADDIAIALQSAGSKLFGEHT